MPSEPVTYSVVLKYIWAPVLGVIGFFAKRTINELEKRVEKIERKQEDILTESKARQMIVDLVAPLHVKQDLTKESVEEVKRRLNKIMEKL